VQTTADKSTSQQPISILVVSILHRTIIDTGDGASLDSISVEKFCYLGGSLNIDGDVDAAVKAGV